MWGGRRLWHGSLDVEALTLLGSVLGIGFVSGLNLYATVITVGLMVNLNLVTIPERLAGVEVLGHPTVMVVAGVMFAVEFFADKIPWIDSAWDGAHTFIRPIGAAVVGGYALTGTDPAIETALALACGGMALTSHTTKASTRVMVNASPEPFSNSFLSVFEDLVVVVGVALSFLLPLLMLAALLVFAIAFLWLAPKFFRVIRGGLARLRGRGTTEESPEPPR
jgi:hypothetical protein